MDSVDPLTLDLDKNLDRYEETIHSEMVMPVVATPEGNWEERNTTAVSVFIDTENHGNSTSSIGFTYEESNIRMFILLVFHKAQINGSHGEYTETDDLDSSGRQYLKPSGGNSNVPIVKAKTYQKGSFGSYKKSFYQYVQKLRDQSARESALHLFNEYYLIEASRRERANWEEDLMPFDDPLLTEFYNRVDEMNARYNADQVKLHAQIKERAPKKDKTAKRLSKATPAIANIDEEVKDDVQLFVEEKLRRWKAEHQAEGGVIVEALGSGEAAQAVLNQPRNEYKHVVCLGNGREDDNSVAAAIMARPVNNKDNYPALRENIQTLKADRREVRRPLRSFTHVPKKDLIRLTWPGWESGFHVDGTRMVPYNPIKFEVAPPVPEEPTPWVRPESWNDQHVFRGMKPEDIHSDIGPCMPPEYLDNIGDGICELPFFERRAEDGYVWSEIAKSAAIGTGLVVLGHVPVLGQFATYQYWVHAAQFWHTGSVFNSAIGPRNRYYNTDPQGPDPGGPFEPVGTHRIPTTNDPAAINAERFPVSQLSAFGDLTELGLRHGIFRTYFRHQEQYQTIWIKENGYTHWYKRRVIAELFVHLYAVYSGALNSQDNLRNMKQYAQNEPTVTGRYNYWLIDATVEVCYQYLSVSACRASYSTELRTHGLPRQSLY